MNDDTSYCDMYVFNTINNTIDGIFCKDYDTKMYKAIQKKEVTELCKLNYHHIVKNNYILTSL